MRLTGVVTTEAESAFCAPARALVGRVDGDIGHGASADAGSTAGAGTGGVERAR